MAKTERKVAVVLIHGIGDQTPMETLRSFVEAVLSKDSAIVSDPADAPENAELQPGPAPLSPAQPSPGDPSEEKTRWRERPLYWSKPDNLSGSYELRRFTTSTGGRGGVAIDFYEYYWAHLMDGNALSHSLQWLNNLLLLWPKSVPPILRRLWWAVWLLIIAIAVAMAAIGTETPIGLIAGTGALLLAGAKLVADLALRDWVGDAARYFNARPANVNVRNAIRKGGVELLEKLHRTGNYHRVIVVGHSLGSAIALDILYHYWSIASVRHGSPDRPFTDAIECLQRTIMDASNSGTPDWKALQKAVWQDLRNNGTPWRITDLITLGSPLTHLPFLTGLDQRVFEDRLAMREFPKCPPIIDGKSLTYPVAYELPDGQKRSIATIHHAGCFAATRWTNIYFPHNGWIGGDPVGGPLKELFGDAVDDRQVFTQRWRGRLNHIHYWRDDPRDRGSRQAPLRVLKAALNLDEGFGPRSRGKSAI